MFTSLVLASVMTFCSAADDAVPAGVLQASSLEGMEQNVRAGLDRLHRAERAEAETREAFLRKRMNEFAVAYNAFIHEYAQGVLDVKKARSLSKAMHNLESVLPTDK